MDENADVLDTHESSRFPILSPAQLSAYLRALRKARNRTQAQLGATLGVTRARVSEIERDPTNLGFSQLLRILHLLGGRLVLEVAATEPADGADAAQSTPRGEW